MHKYVRYAAIAVALTVGLNQAVPAFADRAAEKEQELQNIQRQMQEHAGKSYQAQRKASSVSAQLQIIEYELTQAESDLRGLESQLAVTEEQVRINSGLLAKAEQNLIERNEILYKRMRDMYENGNISYLEVLFGAKDFGDFTSRLELLKRVIAHDLALIERVKVERQTIIEKKAQLEKDKAAIVAFRDQAANKRDTVDLKRQERKDMLDNILTEKETADRAYAELEQTSREIERMIQQMQSPAAKSQVRASGALKWPIIGPITSPFGWRVHPVFGNQRFHTGIDIAADYGDPVTAADNGVVIHSDWLGGYGKAVILDHGNGLQTLYAHNSELLVYNGQAVRKGQQISRAGSTGYSTGPHVHFEVRRNGSPTDPAAYLP